MRLNYTFSPIQLSIIYDGLLSLQRIQPMQESTLIKFHELKNLIGGKDFLLPVEYTKYNHDEIDVCI